MKIMFINGPNLNMLGQREKNIYGSLTLNDINDFVCEKAFILGVEVDFYQSNIEGEIVNTIQQLKTNGFSGLVINAGAYTHTSIAIRDALLAVNIPFVEVHLSNIYKREDFRHISYLSDIAIGSIVGFGYVGYELALEGLKAFINHEL